MADSETYIWRYKLKDFKLTGSISTDYVGTVDTNKSMSMGSVVAQIVSERTDMRTDTLTSAINLYEEKVKELVCQGYTVVTGTAIYRPTITGTFVGRTGEFDSSRNKCVVTVNPSQSFREQVALVTPQFTGTVIDTGGAEITQVIDAETEEIDGVITPGNTITIVGNKIRCVAADGSSTGVVRFINAETLEVTEVTKLALNNPSKVILIVPAALTAGTYTLQIDTYYSSSGSVLKSVRTIEYAVQLTVASSSSSSSTDTETTE